LVVQGVFFATGGTQAVQVQVAPIDRTAFEQALKQLI
jgi:hypothetical protein